VAGNLKLACTEKGAVRIETRGEGGYFLITPSPGYEIISGSLKDCPLLSAAEVQEIHNVAKMFDERKATSATSATNTKETSSDSPGHLFNEAHKVEDILLAHGWRQSKQTTAGMGYTRPGKDAGTSGVLLNSTGNFYCWSSNASPLENGRSYDAFGLYAAFNHAGDLSAAARELGGGKKKIYTPSAADNPTSWEPSFPDWPTMNERVYRGIAGDLVRLATRKTEVDPVAVLMTFIVRFGVEVGEGVFMQVGDSRQRLRLASVLVGNSGKSRKGTSAKPVEKAFNFADITAPSFLCVTSARTSEGPFSSGEGIIYAVRDAVTRWNLKDQVEEVVDPGVEDKRLFVLDEEFSGVLANTKREGNTLSQIIRRAWDNGNFDPLTKNSKIRATCAQVGWVSHITLNELNAKLGITEGFNGFANRILWACVRRNGAEAFPEPMPENELQAIQLRLLEVLAVTKEGCEMKLSDEARAAWGNKYYAKLSQDRPGLVGCVTNRGEAQTLRLAMAYALLDGETTISLDHLEAGLAVWEYCEQSAKYIFHGRMEDSTTQTILDALKQGPMTGTEIHGLFENNANGDKLKNALHELMASNQVTRETEKKTKGAPTNRYRFCEDTERIKRINELSPPVSNEEPIKLVNSLNSYNDNSEPIPIKLVNSLNSYKESSGVLKMEEFEI